MRRKLGAGLLAAAAAVLLPLVVCGMGRERLPETEEAISETEIAGAASSPEYEANPAGEAEPSPAAQTPVQPPSETARKVTAIVVHQNQKTEPESAAEASGDAAIGVTVTVGGRPETMCLRDYLTGVIMGEMPASYPLEALKAQAVAARTYTLRRMERGGVLSDDPAVCQAYIPVESAEERFGEQAAEYLEKLRLAVDETDGQVLTYEGELISATYFSCSGGRTESAQAVWGSEVPYLVSVDSPGEEAASGYESTVTMSREEFMDTLGVASAGVSGVTYTDGGGVQTMEIGGKTFTGVELREKLGLKSTRFTMELTAGTVTFSVQGYGHRVGLSQNGARVMAEDGADYETILKWYYTGVSLDAYARG